MQSLAAIAASANELVKLAQSSATLCLRLSPLVMSAPPHDCPRKMSASSGVHRASLLRRDDTAIVAALRWPRWARTTLQRDCQLLLHSESHDNLYNMNA
eukprot:6181657-Pleurochrysis_carterae.AAC.2